MIGREFEVAKPAFKGGEDMLFTERTISQVNDNPLYRALGIRIENAAEGQARSRLEPSPEVCWPFPGQPHGGILFTLMDTTMAWAVLTQLDPGYNCSTISLDIHYTRPAKGSLFHCTAQVSHQTTRYCFVRAEIHDADGKLVALGQATFAVIEMEIRH
jgi:uncharacterized protein (TIGR00369 family)